MSDYLRVPLGQLSKDAECSRCGRNPFEGLQSRESVEKWIHTLAYHRTCVRRCDNCGLPAENCACGEAAP